MIALVAFGLASHGFAQVLAYHRAERLNAYYEHRGYRLDFCRHAAD